MWEDYAATIGKTANNLSQQEKIQAEVNGIMNETRFQVGDAAKYADTYAGRLAYLSKTLGDIRVNIGQAFMPIANFVIPILQKLANWLVRVTTYFKYFMQAFFGVSKSQKQSSVVAGGGAVAQDSFGTALENAGKKAEKSGKKVKKAAEEARRSVAGFDEVNTLNEPHKGSGADSSGGSGAGGVGGIGMDDMGISDFDMPEIDTETIPAKIQEMVDKIKDSFKNLQDGAKGFGSMFADAFSGIGPAIQPLRDAVAPIKQSFREIGGAISRSLEEFLKPFASYILSDFVPSIVTGFVKDFAPVIADGWVWGFDLMAKHAQLTTDMVVGLWNDVWLPAMESFKTAWLEMSSAIASTLQSLLDGTIKPLTEYILNDFLLPIVNQLNRVFVPIFTDVLVFAMELFSKTFKNLTDTLNNLTSTVILPALEKIKNAFMDMVPRIGGALQSLLDGTIKPFIDYILNDFVIPIAGAIIETLVPIFTDSLVFAFKETASGFEWLAKIMNDIYKTVIKPVFDLIKKIVTDTLKIVMDLWDKHGKTLLAKISEMFDKIKTIFQSLWDKILKPIVTPFLEMLTWLWDKHLKDLVKTIGEFVVKVINAALDIVNEFILPLVYYLVEILGPTFVRIFNFIVDVVGTVVGTISDIIKGLLNILGGLIDFLVGVFSGDWGRAWKGIVSVFEGIVDLISGIFKGVLNITIDVINTAVRTVLDTINSMIKGAIALINAIPGVDININPIAVPKIPKLAKGGITNGPMLAMIGDNPGGREVVSPLSDFKDMIVSAVGTAVMAVNHASGSRQQSFEGSSGDIVIMMDTTEVARILNAPLQREQGRIGSSIIRPI